MKQFANAQSRHVVPAFLTMLLLFVGGIIDDVRAGVLPDGKKAITLIAADGARMPIGHVIFSPQGDGARIAVTLDAPEFKDEFLSMRPFRCLPDAKEMWCHLAYPYEIKGTITPGDLTDLEYQLLFLFKAPASYGIDAWNGLYFKLTIDPAEGLRGDLHEGDFNILAIPPEAGNLRPLPHSALTPVAPDAHRFARLEIR